MSKHLTGIRLFFTTTIWTLGFFSIFVILTLISLVWFGYVYLNKVSSVGGIDLATLKDNIVTGWESDMLHNKSDLTFLVLGVDSVPNKPDAPQLTDTILFINLNLNSGKLSAVSLPRDLWSEEYMTKINALYWYGKQRDQSQPTQFPEQVLEELTGVPIDTVVVVSLDTVADIINALSGVEVTVEQNFTDNQFPRSDADPSSSDPAVLYETVTFNSGKQIMDGQTALKYIRSRKSSNETEGTDLARSKRQTQVIDALVHKAIQKQTIRDPEAVGKLLRIYNQKFAPTLPLPDVVAIGKKMYEQRALDFSFNTYSLSIYPDNPLGVITHPTPSAQYQNQWVYIIRDRDLFTQEMVTALGSTAATQSSSINKN